MYGCLSGGSANRLSGTNLFPICAVSGVWGLLQSNEEEQGHQAVDRDNVDTHLAETAIMIVLAGRRCPWLRTTLLTNLMATTLEFIAQQRSIRRRLAGDARMSLGAASTPNKAAAGTTPPAPGAALAVASPTEDLMVSPPVYQVRNLLALLNLLDLSNADHSRSSICC